MSRVPGIGEKKLADYGQQFVDCIVTYCTQHGLSLDQPRRPSASAPSSLRPKQPKLQIKAKSDAFEMFAKGASIDEVHQRIDRARSTTGQYLGEFIAMTKRTDPAPWVDAATASEIRAAIEQVGSVERLAPIKELLREEISYEQIRVVVECIKVATGYYAAVE